MKSLISALKTSAEQYITWLTRQNLEADSESHFPLLFSYLVSMNIRSRGRKWHCMNTWAKINQQISCVRKQHSTLGTKAIITYYCPITITWYNSFRSSTIFIGIKDSSIYTQYSIIYEKLVSSLVNLNIINLSVLNNSYGVFLFA